MDIEPKPLATPDSTPIPGGGRWAWDYAACAWREVVEPASAEPQAQTLSPTEPTSE